MLTTALRRASLLAAAAMLVASPLRAQGAPATPDSAKPQSGRAELERRAVAAEQSATHGDAKQRARAAAEASLLRERLRDGDLNVGDRIYLEVRGGEEPFADTVTVRAGRVITLPKMPEISVQGVLRSELEGYLTKQIARYIREPYVRATPLIRVSMLGAIGQPGFYALPADVLLSDAIMRAGGPTGNTDLNKVTVRRGGRVILDSEEARRAIDRGMTLDQMNLRAGDEVAVGERRKFPWGTALQITSLAVTLGYLVTRVAN